MGWIHDLAHVYGHTRVHANTHPHKSYLTLSDVQIADGLIFHTKKEAGDVAMKQAISPARDRPWRAEKMRSRKRWKAQRQILSSQQLAQTLWRNMSIWLLFSNVACFSNLLPKAMLKTFRLFLQGEKWQIGHKETNFNMNGDWKRADTM